MKNKKKGFTLVELLVVITIIAVLSAVSIVGFTSFTKRAKESNAHTELSTAKNYIIAGIALGDILNVTYDEKAYVVTFTNIGAPGAVVTVRDNFPQDITVHKDEIFDQAIKYNYPELSSLKTFSLNEANTVVHYTYEPGIVASWNLITNEVSIEQ